MVIPDHESRIVAGQEGCSLPITEAPLLRVLNHEDLTSPMDDSDEELKLPDTISLFLVVLGNVLLQISFYIVVSSANAYSEYLGGTATFSGLIFGVPSLIAGLVLCPMVKYDRGRYKLPMTAAYGFLILGNILYAMAYHAKFLYLILIGRIVSGLGFTSLMYCKRYCSDPRIVGVRRRTTLASLIVIGQGLGFTLGPFLGGILYKVGFPNTIFNGFTGPGWLFSGIWAVFFAASVILFKDVRLPYQQTVKPEPSSDIHVTPGLESVPPSKETGDAKKSVSVREWGVVGLMMWYAMTCFLILGSWESNIPVYTAIIFGYDPYQAGNFISLGGAATFPFLLLNVWYSRRLEDRVILVYGSLTGLCGLFIMLALVYTNNVIYPSFFICWFLVALGFNLASTCTLSLLSKLLPPSWNGRISLAIQLSNYVGRVTGGVLGGSGVKMGIPNFLGLQIGLVGVGLVLQLVLWRNLKAKIG